MPCLQNLSTPHHNHRYSWQSTILQCWNLQNFYPWYDCTTNYTLIRTQGLIELSTRHFNTKIAPGDQK